MLVNHHAECVKAIDAVPDIVRLVVLGESQEVSLPASAERLGLALRNHDGPEDGAGVKVLAVDPEGRSQYGPWVLDRLLHPLSLGPDPGAGAGYQIDAVSGTAPPAAGPAPGGFPFGVVSPAAPPSAP